MFQISDKYIRLLREVVEDTFGRSPECPTDFDQLSAAIYAKNHENIGVSTLKRIWGYVQSSHKPTFSTLSVLSRFSGYRDWNSFCHQILSEDESDFTRSSVIVCSEEKIGSSLKIKWGYGKGCVITKSAEPNFFEVTESTNIKLKKGDFVKINTLAIGDFFVALDCLRGTTQLGTYVGAKKHGISEIERKD